MSASKLVRRIEAGDRQAEEELVRRYSKGLTYLLRHLTRDPVLSDDLHQETFRIVIEKLRRGELNTPEALPGFLRGTARNLVRAERRRAVRRERPYDPDYSDPDQPSWQPADPAPDQETSLQWRQEVALVRRLLADMRSRDQELLLRFCVAEQDKEEICAALELSSLQFNVVLCRARKRFRQLYEEQMQRMRCAMSAIAALLATLCW